MRDGGRWLPVKCPRCRGAGTIEVVEIAAAELERLRVTRDRFTWLLAEYCHVTRASPHKACDEIDELIAAGFSCGKVRSRASGNDPDSVAKQT